MQGRERTNFRYGHIAFAQENGLSSFEQREITREMRFYFVEIQFLHGVFVVRRTQAIKSMRDGVNDDEPCQREAGRQ